jgi:ribonuclease HI
MLQKVMLPVIKNVSHNFVKIHPEINFKLKFDGCSKSNPGISGAGAVIYKDDEELWGDNFFVGLSATNNHAEYAGLILGLEKAIQINIKRLIVEGDSLLVINQMTGKYRCNSLNLISLYEKAKELEKEFDSIYFNHIYRSENKRADELSNIAVREYCNKYYS